MIISLVVNHADALKQHETLDFSVSDSVAAHLMSMPSGEKP